MGSYVCRCAVGYRFNTASQFCEGKKNKQIAVLFSALASIKKKRIALNSNDMRLTGDLCTLLVHRKLH